MSTPTLDYANPAVFLDGVNRHRSSGPLLGMVGFLLFGGVAACLAIDGPIPPAARLLVGGGAFILLLGAFYLATLAIVNRQDAVRITANGITHGRQFWPWSRITYLGGFVSPPGSGVTVTFTVGYAGLPFPRPLLTTPPLATDQFVRLMAEVGEHLPRYHPHVKVDPQPREA